MQITELKIEKEAKYGYPKTGTCKIRLESENGLKIIEGSHNFRTSGKKIVYKIENNHLVIKYVYDLDIKQYIKDVFLIAYGLENIQEYHLELSLGSDLKDDYFYNPIDASFTIRYKKKGEK